MSIEKLPPLTRLRRVDYYLATETKYYNAVEGTEDYVKKDEKITFKKSVWRVTEAIIKAGIDPCILKKDAVFQWAEHALLGAAQPSTQIQTPPQAKTTPTEKSTEKAGQEPQGGFNLPVGVAIYTLLLSACEIARMDTTAGREERRKALEDVAKLYLGSVKSYVVPAQVVSEPEAAEVQEETPAITGTAPVLA